MDINKLNRHFIAVDNLNNIDTVIDVLTEPWIIKYEDTYYSTESNNNMKFTSLKSPEYIKQYYDANRSTILALCTSEDNKYYTFVYKNLLTDLNDYNDSEGNSFIEYVKDIIIPNSVTSISLGMFSGKENLKSITLSNSLTSIHSFDGCTNLTYIDIPNSVTTIEQNAFNGCTNLETVKIGNSLSEINNDAFKSCSSLKSIVIPSSVNYIKDNVFFNCTNMSSVILNNGVKTIGENAFGNCMNLTSIKLPESLTSIAANAFTKCEHLTIISTEYGDFKTDLYGDVSIMYNNGNSMIFNVRGAINNEIWYTTTDNKKLKLPYSDDVLTIQQHEYTRGKGVITFDGQLTNIVTNLFMGNEDLSTLSTIQIPLTVVQIAESAFAECISLKSIKLTNDDIENDNIEIIGSYAFANCNSLTHIVLPNSINSIGKYAFENCVMLNNIILPNNLTTITQYSFKACKSLTSITIPSKVTTIENNAFQECFNIKHIDFTPTITSTGESKITSIGEYAFSQCNLLTSVNLYDINIIGNKAFSDCLSLRSVKFNTINANHNINKNVFEGCKNLDYIIVDDEIFYREYDKITVYDSDKQPLTFVIIIQGNDEIWYTSADGNVITPPSTGEFNVNITNNIYENGKGVITFDGDITNIGNSAFYGCGDLTSITIPNSVTSIGYTSFTNCSSLNSIIVKEGNTVYDSRGNCNAIIETATNTLIVGCKNTTVPNTVTYIGMTAFAECKSLTSITIPNSVIGIEEAAFAECSSLTSVTVGNNTNTIGTSAFYGCYALTSVTLGNGVTTILEFAFEGCSSLTSITIPSNVADIEEAAFLNCQNLTSIIYEGTKEQWENIHIRDNSFSNGNTITVKCSDGDITIEN